MKNNEKVYLAFQATVVVTSIVLYRNYKKKQIALRAKKRADMAAEVRAIIAATNQITAEINNGTYQFRGYDALTTDLEFYTIMHRK